MLQIFYILIITIFLCVISNLGERRINDTAGIEFLILHNNDMHARFEQIKSENGKFYGGFARTAHEIRRYRDIAQKGGKPVLYLNAGDTFSGTTWFTIYKANITTEFMNILKPDAICLGNHEFDEGITGLIEFMKNVQFPIVTANLNLKKTPELSTISNLKNSIILEISGYKIGIVGYLTPDTKFLSSPTDVEIVEEIAAINNETEILKAKGVNIFIALGHSGYAKDQDIARNCPDIDIVVGGHTNTFLYNGDQPDSEIIDGPYPTVVTQSNGKIVPVVQAYAYTKYLGKLSVAFDKNGNLTRFNGLPIFLDSQIPEEPDVLELLEKYRPNITALKDHNVGVTQVTLNGLSCRLKECNLGNLIADAMIYARSLEIQNVTEFETDTAIAIIQGGGIRASIETHRNGQITMNDILTVLPWQNRIFVAKVKGSALRQGFERSAAVWKTDSNGGFMQVSGIKITYDMAQKIGNRVIDVQVNCAQCLTKFYSPLQDEQYYNILVPEFILNGGDGYNLTGKINPSQDAQVLKKLDFELLADYISYKSPIQIGIESRIHILNKSYRNSLNLNLITFLIFIHYAVSIFTFK